MSRSFPIASMDTPMTAITAVVLVLPVVFAIAGLVPSPAAPVMLLTAVSLVAVYAAVWLLGRPSRYEVDAEGVHMHFPLWTRTVPASAIRSVRTFPGAAFRKEVGWGLRVGAGGLWGGFGWLITPIGTLEMYISRTGDLVLVECEGQKSLLVSPGDVDGFVTAVRRLAA